MSGPRSLPRHSSALGSVATVGVAIMLSVMTWTSTYAGGVSRHELPRHVEGLQLRDAMGAGGRSVCQASAGTSRGGGKGAHIGAQSQVAGPLPARRRIRPLRRRPLSLFRARLRIRCWRRSTAARTRVLPGFDP